MILVGCSSILVALEPSDVVCVSQKWFITLGYTLELVPLLVKIAAINKVLAATRQMKQIRIDIQSLFLTVAGIILAVLTFLTTWTVMDPAQRQEGRYLNELGDVTEVVTTVTCASESALWDVAVLCWNGILVLCATVLAFQSRRAEGKFNDSKSLGMIIYSHFLFAVLRVIFFAMSTSHLSIDDEEEYRPSSLDPSNAAAWNSFLLSFDVITAVTIYVVPKLVAAKQPPPASSESTSTPPSTRFGIRTTLNSRDIPLRGTVPQKIQPNSKVAPDGSEMSGLGMQSGIVPESPSVGNHVPSHRRLGMDGHVYTDDEDESTSSNEEDWGGPRLTHTSAPTSGPSITGLSIDVIREVDESSI